MPMLPLRRGFSMQQGPEQTSDPRTMMAILYPQDTPHIPFYPRSPYGLAGLGVCIGYDYPALAAAAGIENCTTYGGDSNAGYLCTQRNIAKQQEIMNLSPSGGGCITQEDIDRITAMGAGTSYVPSPGAANPPGGGIVASGPQPIQMQPYLGPPVGAGLPLDFYQTLQPPQGAGSSSTSSTTSGAASTTSTPSGASSSTVPPASGGAQQSAAVPPAAVPMLFGLPETTVLIGGGVALLVLMMAMGRR